MKLATLTALGLALMVGGCASQAELDRIDAKFDQILAEHCGGDRQACGHQEQVRLQDKAYANSPMSRFNNYLAHTFGWGGGAGSSGATYVIIVN